MIRVWLAGLLAVAMWPSLAAGAEQAHEGRLIFLRDYGAEGVAYLAVPDSPPHGGVVLVPDSHGLDDRIRLFSDRLAHQGHIVLAVDIHNGRTAETADEARAIAEAVIPDVAARVIRTGFTFYESSPRFHTERYCLMLLGDSAFHYNEQINRRHRRLAAAVIIDPPELWWKQPAPAERIPLLMIAGDNAMPFDWETIHEGTSVRRINHPAGFWRGTDSTPWQEIIRLADSFWRDASATRRSLLPWAN